jgi:hypothetical protein
MICFVCFCVFMCLKNCMIDLRTLDKKQKPIISLTVLSLVKMDRNSFGTFHSFSLLLFFHVGGFVIK